MKAAKILTSTLIFFALNLNSFAAEKSENILSSIDSNKSDSASVFIGNGRNKSSRSDAEFIVKGEKKTPYNESAELNKNILEQAMSML